MKNLFVRTSRKHWLGLPIGFLTHLILFYTNWFGWNELIYNDEWPFIGYFEIGPWLGQSLITILVAGIGAGWFEYFQQRNLEEKPSFADTKNDVIVTTVAVYLGYLISMIIF